MIFCRQIRIGYFSQHHVDQLDLRLSSVGLMQERFPGKPVEEYRRQLGRFGVSGDLALQQLASLSGMLKVVFLLPTNFNDLLLLVLFSHGFVQHIVFDTFIVLNPSFTTSMNSFPLLSQS